MDILFENKDILIVYKKSGVPVQGDNSGIKSLVDEASEYIGKEAFVITRLDRPVQGVCLFAKSKGSAGRLSQMVQNHEIHKTYYAVVCGKPDKSGRLENYIFKNQRQNISKIVNKGNIGAKLAQLEYEVLDTKNELSLVKIKLITGRHHQIRVQFAHIGCPLYGDTKYNPLFKHKRGVTTALFAGGLSFKYDNKEINVNAEPCDNVLLDFSIGDYNFQA